MRRTHEAQRGSGPVTLAEARTAISVDFECLATTPPQPMLLGILNGADGEHFEQIIIDERLAPAKVANVRCRVATVEAAVTELVSRANAEDRRSWAGASSIAIV